MFISHSPIKPPGQKTGAIPKIHNQESVTTVVDGSKDVPSEHSAGGIHFLINLEAIHTRFLEKFILRGNELLPIHLIIYIPLRKTITHY